MKRMFVVMGLMAVVLSACETTQEERGALLGAVAGGILGNQIGGGSGQMLATASGVMIGAFAGASIGAKMDDVDKMKMSQTYQHSLENNRVGEETNWQNPDSGNSGSMVPTRTYQNNEQQYCREFQQTITIDGETQKGHGTACRQPDGSWKIVG